MCNLKSSKKSTSPVREWKYKVTVNGNTQVKYKHSTWVNLLLHSSTDHIITFYCMTEYIAPCSLQPRISLGNLTTLRCCIASSISPPDPQSLSKRLFQAAVENLWVANWPELAKQISLTDVWLKTEQFELTLRRRIQQKWMGKKQNAAHLQGQIE